MKVKKIAGLSALFFGLALATFSCSKDELSYNTNSRELVIEEAYEYSFTTPEVGKLGRILFYDNALSINNSVSCGSCHIQSRAFADDKRFSKGFENLETSRNTPPIQDLGAFGITNGIIAPGVIGERALFWDGREKLLQNMVMQPIFNHVEMGMSDTKKVVSKVASKGYYAPLFKDAFGDEQITFERISLALTGFVASIGSVQPIFDLRFPAFMPDPSLTAAEERGSRLFMEKYNCSSCHNVFSPSGYSEPLGSELINIGLDFNYEDQGKGALTGVESDNGKFKIPSLRNVAVTGPYMHDGRFETLEEVLDHYSTGVLDHPNLDDRLKDASGKPLVLHITPEEKQDLIAFLHTLSDESMLRDPKFSDPFKKR